MAGLWRGMAGVHQGMDRRASLAMTGLLVMTGLWCGDGGFGLR
jgi:hypothetical protein